MTEAQLFTNMRNGIIGSLAGGIVFGLVMTLMGMMKMVAALVGSDNIGVGWIVHLVMSMILGVGLGRILHAVDGNRIQTGLVWGVVAWLGGALFLMPLWLGMPVFSLGATTAWFSLFGHLLYGLSAGIVVWDIERQTDVRTDETTVVQQTANQA